MDIMKALRRYVADEYENKTDKCVDTSKWKIRWAAGSPCKLMCRLQGSLCVTAAVFTMLLPLCDTMQALRKMYGLLLPRIASWQVICRAGHGQALCDLQGFVAGPACCTLHGEDSNCTCMLK